MSYTTGTQVELFSTIVCASCDNKYARLSCLNTYLNVFALDRTLQITMLADCT